jgi:arylformamidase
MHYRGYDQQALDDQYNARKACPDIESYLARWPQSSHELRQGGACDLDLAFGESAAETLDIFHAEGARPPLLVFIHGGYWRAFDKDDFSFVARGYLAAGISVAVINYALAPGVTMDEIVRQNRAALAWLHRNAGRHGADPDRLYVSGHSAGGHLTAMMMCTDWPAFEPGLPADLVKGGCAISGLYDLEPIRLSYLNAEVGLDPEMARRNSPLHLAPASAAPFMLCVGGGESDEFHRQTREFADHWRHDGRPLEVMTPPGLDHFAIMEAFADVESALARAVRRQVLGEGE